MTAYSKDNFQGVIAVDSEGFVVWYANVTTVVSRDDRKLISSPHIVGFDQFADGSVCLADAGTNMLLKVGVDGETQAFHEFPARPALRHQQGPYSNATYHECRVTPEQKVLAVGQHSMAVPTFTVMSDGKVETCDGVLDEVVYEWDPTSDAVKALFHVSDYVPWQQLLPYFRDTSTSGIVLERADNGYVTMYHTSSVSVSSDGKLYIVSLRDINTVLAIDRSTLERVWMVSSTLATNSTFALSETTKFYQVHDALLYSKLGPGGEDVLTLMDDGNEREGCDTGDISESVPTLCASRGLGLRLPTRVGAHAQTQLEYSTPSTWGSKDFETNDVFNYDGGSMVLINGTGARAQWLCSFTDTDKTGFTSSSYIFQLDASGDVRGEMLLPRVTWPDNTESGSYRVNPLITIGGERSKGLSAAFDLPADADDSDDAPATGTESDDNARRRKR